MTDPKPISMPELKVAPVTDPQPEPNRITSVLQVTYRSPLSRTPTTVSARYSHLLTSNGQALQWSKLIFENELDEWIEIDMGWATGKWETLIIEHVPDPRTRQRKQDKEKSPHLLLASFVGAIDPHPIALKVNRFSLLSVRLPSPRLFVLATGQASAFVLTAIPE